MTRKTFIIDGPHAGEWVDFPDDAPFWEAPVQAELPMFLPLARVVYYPSRITFHDRLTGLQTGTVLTVSRDPVSALYVFDCLLQLAGKRHGV